MNILYTNFHTSPGMGGHTVYVMSLLRALAPRHRLFVAVPPGSALSRLAREVPGVRVFDQSFRNRPFARMKAAARLCRLIRQHHIDVVHVNGSSDHRTVTLACMGLGRGKPRVVLTKHNDVAIGKLGPALRARLATHGVIGVSGYVARQLQQSPYAALPIVAIGNGVDTDHFAPWPDEARRAERQRLLGQLAANCRLLVGSNAGTDGYKGWMDMVRALALLGPRADGVYVALAGAPIKPDLRAELEASGLADRVIFAGQLSDVRPFIAALDLGFVLSHREALSFACREMMSMGLPMIVTDQGGLPENVSPGSDGWIVPRGNPDAVAGVLQAVLQDPTCLARMGAAARSKSVDQFSLAAFVLQTENVYQEVVNKR